MDQLFDADENSINPLVQDAEDRIQKATALQFMINTEGWHILLDTFEDMKHNQLEELSKQTPGDEKAILAAHAIWYSVVHTLDNIITAVNSAIQDGESAKFILDTVRTKPEEDF